MNKQQKRSRRARRTRAKVQQLGRVRLCVYRSLNHMYAQLIAPTGDRVLVTASTLEKALREQHPHRGNRAAAATVGQLIAERGVKAGIQQVAFDRAGYKYHGRVKALAEAARAGGLKF